MNRTRIQLTLSVCAALVAGTVAAAQNHAGRRAAETQALATWNIIALQTTAAAPLNPPREARALAMVSAAVFDAVNSITQEHAPYLLKAPASREASHPTWA